MARELHPFSGGSETASTARLALQGATDERLCRVVPELRGEHARRILSAVHRERSIDAVPGIPSAARDALRERTHLPSLRCVASLSSRVDPFRKYAFQVPGGARVEAVRIPLEDPARFSVCVSSQVGCALACEFCATGRLGLERNLEAWEIVEQVREVRRGIPARARVHGLVFQGMGEPLANVDQVLAAIDVCTAPYALAIDARNITVCTAGLPAGIRKLARSAPRVRLGISIGSADPAVRAQLMPISAAHELVEVVDAAVEHALATGLSPMWAVTLLGGVNDSDAQARGLAALARQFRDRTGRSPRVSVIAYNPIDHSGADPFSRADDARVAAFRDILAAAGFRSSRRYSGGADIAAACGQLVAAG
jgi:23S rRNA (adenine2503-C2)-methyltransferase